MKTYDFGAFKKNPFDLFKDTKLPTLDFEAAMTAQRKAIETLQAAQKAALETGKKLAKANTAYAQSAFGDIKEHFDDMNSAKPLDEKMKAQANRVKISLEKATAHSKDVMEILKKSGEDMTSALKDTFSENMNKAQEWTENAKASSKPSKTSKS